MPDKPKPPKPSPPKPSPLTPLPSPPSVINWGTEFRLGLGYRTATFQHISDPAVIVEAEPNEPSPTAEILKGSILVDSAETFEQAASISASFSSGFIGIGVSASARFMRDANVNRKTMAALAYAHWRDEHFTKVYHENTSQLTDTAKDLLETQGPGAFYNKYGDCFIGGFYQGGHCFATYRMEFSSVQERTKATASVEAAYSATSGSASFEASLNTNKVNCTKSLKMDATGFPTGSLSRTHGTWEEAIEFMDKIDTRLGEKTQAVLVPYDVLTSYSKALKSYKQNNPKAEEFVVPTAAFPGSEAILNVNKMLVQLSYLTNQLQNMVTPGLSYDNPGDIQRVSCLEALKKFLAGLTSKDSVGQKDLAPLLSEGAKLVQRAEEAVDNFDGTVIELWNTARIGQYAPHRGDVRVSLEDFHKGAGLVLYSAGPNAGAAPGPPPITSSTSRQADLASKFKVWDAGEDSFMLQALGVKGQDQPIFVGLPSANFTKPFAPRGVVFVQMTASFTKEDHKKDSRTRCFKKKDAGDGMVYLTFDEHATPGGPEGPYCIRIAPAQGHWAPMGNDITPYWMVGLNPYTPFRVTLEGLSEDERHRWVSLAFRENWPEVSTAPPEWSTDGNAMWRIKVVDDPAGAGGHH